jgi:regulator-associated protein of mTOR
MTAVPFSKFSNPCSNLSLLSKGQNGLEDTQSTINEVTKEIRKLEQKIEEIEAQILTEKDSDEKRQLRDKERQLRDEKGQLRDEKSMLRKLIAGNENIFLSVYFLFFCADLINTEIPKTPIHYSHTSAGWVNYCHLRSDVPEVIIGSVRGSVKFWDLRTMRTHKTLEVQKSPITSMAVHNCAPIMATGSHAQFIKILTLGGEQLGNIIKYYDGFLGERIGPISYLAFHPYKLLLAASSTTGLISLYHTAGENKTS